MRQPGQALLELQGHGAPVNCMEWSPSRRGTLASGADDSLVLVWDLLNPSNATAVPGANGNQSAAGLHGPGGGAAAASAGPGGPGSGGPGAAAAAAAAAGSSDGNARGPMASWQCDYEVNNLSWAPQSPLTGQGRDWLGVSGGRSIWGVSL